MVEEKKVVEERSLPLWIILSLVTCGIAGWVWLVMIADDIKELKGGDKPSGVLDVILGLVTCGIYFWYVYYQYPKHVVDIQKAKGKEESDISVLCLILGIFFLGIVSMALIQNEVNKFAVPKPEA